MKRLAAFSLLLAGCGSTVTTEPPAGPTLTFTTAVMKSVAAKPGTAIPGITNAPSDYASFTIASSEYPSWAALGVAGRRGLIDPAKGRVGPLERKWNVDIVLVFKDYDACITGFGTKTYDAIAVTNIDILVPSLGRPAVAYCPTSTSDGGDALIGIGWRDSLYSPQAGEEKRRMKGADIGKFLTGKKVRGLEKSVSEYVFARVLEEYGLDATKYTFSNMDPAQAAQGMQQGQEGFDAIMVWNPFVRQSLKTGTPGRTPALVFTSHEIPGEVIDMLVAGRDVYDTEPGKRFCAATVDAYYSVCRLLDDTALRDEILVDLGKNFSSLDAKEMGLCLQDTHFYATADEGIKVYQDTKLPGVMDKVVGFAKRHQMLEKGQEPRLGFER